MQTVMLAARKYNLHTCLQAAWINYQQPIFEHLNIPSDQVLVSGMAMGYENKEGYRKYIANEKGRIIRHSTFSWILN